VTLRLLAYLWASPNTLLGLCFIPIVFLTGGHAKMERGVLEVYGGFARFFLRRCLFVKASALCIGHVILAQDRDSLDHARDHERIHVGQYERWGPITIPAYLISGTIAWWRGGSFYFDNRFEREAYGRSC
jgi:hypothetical protein